MKSLLSKCLLIVVAFLLPAQAHGDLTFVLTSPVPASGTPVDVFDAAFTPTTYNGTWSESNSGASGAWAVDFADTSSSGTAIFRSGLSVVNFAGGISGGQGLQFFFDANAGGNGSDRSSLIDFSYTINSLGSANASDFGAAIAFGPFGGGVLDSLPGNVTDANGNVIANSTIFDGPLGGTPVFDAATGRLDSRVTDISSNVSGNHDWTILFPGTQTLSYDGSFNDDETIVFGIGLVAQEAVPEPSSAAVLALGSVLALIRRQRK